MKKIPNSFSSKTHSLTTDAIWGITLIFLLPFVLYILPFADDFLRPPDFEYRFILEVIGLILIWLIILLFIRHLFSGVHGSLQDFAKSIVQKGSTANESTPEPAVISELQPVFTEIRNYVDNLERANKKLLDIQNQLINLFDKIDEGFFVLNRDFEIIYINRKIEELIGKKRDEFLFKNIWECLPNIVGGGFYQQLQRGMKDRQPLSWEMSWQGNKSLRINVYPFQNGLAVFVQDISFRKMLEFHALELTSIVSNASIAIIGLSADGQIMSWNPGAAKLFGYNLDEVIGKHLFDLITPQDKSQLDDIQKSLSQGIPIPVFECVGPHRNGTEIYALAELSYVRNAKGRVVHISAIITDITPIVRSAKEFARLERLNLIGQMAAGISHEVRNPLTTIRGFLQILSSKNDLLAYRDYFELMISELDRANTLITEFLSLTKERPLNLELFNLNEIIEKLFPIVQADAFKSNKEIVLELEATPKILIDPYEVRQLILNLVRNALEASPQGAKVIIRTKQLKQQVTIEVQDFGSGIPPHILNKLGTPFVTTKEGGTGIGLTICYGIAKRHQAQIALDTGPNGTTFSVYFPVHETDVPN